MNQPEKPKKGGAMPGAGRPPLGYSERIEVRVNAEQKAAYQKAGGQDWFRKLLDSFRVNT